MKYCDGTSPFCSGPFHKVMITSLPLVTTFPEILVYSVMSQCQQKFTGLVPQSCVKCWVITDCDPGHSPRYELVHFPYSTLEQ